jgi:hypothetical protein
MNGYRKTLFPIHIYQANIKENDKIKSLVLDKIEKCHHKKNIPVPDGWHTDKIYTSFDLHEINDLIFGKQNVLHPYYIKYISKFFDDKFKIVIHDTWFNYYVNGEYQEIHNHLSPSIFTAPSHFSCIHYLTFNPEKHEPVRFMDPLEEVRYSSLEFNSHRYSGTYTPTIQEGDFFMFPSYLEHFVKKSEPTPDYPRITIALNFAVLNYGEQGITGENQNGD